MNGRKRPYTEIGIRRLKCVRCGERAVHQWQICADDGLFRPICEECDIALNELFLRWIGFPDWRQKIAGYRRELSN